MAVWSAGGERFASVEALAQRMGLTRSAAVDGRVRVGGSTRSALARGEPLETEALHGDIVQKGLDRGVQN